MSFPCYGRYQTAEPYASLATAHRYSGEDLKVVHHPPKVGVLDQSDLIEQGIIVSSFIPGAPQNVDALGSCTANGTTAAISNTLPEEKFLSVTGASSYEDVKGAERFAIEFYHKCTDQTGDPSTEWPPTDCGSSGVYIVDELRSMSLASGDKIATTATDIVSLLQSDGVLIGSPWFYAWEEPTSDGFIDTGGIEAAIRSGVAGGHETYWWGVDALGLTSSGAVDPTRTVIVGRNSWSDTWGDLGDYRTHLSTFMAIASHCDWRQIVPA